MAISRGTKGATSQEGTASEQEIRNRPSIIDNFSPEEVLIDLGDYSPHVRIAMKYRILRKSHSRDPALDWHHICRLGFSSQPL